ncbi:MAG TPA: hypothetical protein PLZ36_00305 [Armatimonadota bacterium]|nr:hypothetical protein [Armatimonadota bacterium]
MALARKDQITLTDTPRLIDFAQWMTAAEPALGWEEGTFLDAYLPSRTYRWLRVRRAAATPTSWRVRGAWLAHNLPGSG